MYKKTIDYSARGRLSLPFHKLNDESPQNYDCILQSTLPTPSATPAPYTSLQTEVYIVLSLKGRIATPSLPHHPPSSPTSTSSTHVPTPAIPTGDGGHNYESLPLLTYEERLVQCFKDRFPTAVVEQVERTLTDTTRYVYMNYNLPFIHTSILCLYLISYYLYV